MSDKKFTEDEIRTAVEEGFVDFLVLDKLLAQGGIYDSPHFGKFRIRVVAERVE